MRGRDRRTQVTEGVRSTTRDRLTGFSSEVLPPIMCMIWGHTV